jgi:hypothetical protein
MASGLAALQARMQQDILHRDGSALDAIAVPPGHRAEDRLFVYQNAYVARLVEIMGKDYDTTWTYLGDQLFYDLARQFIAAHPSKTPNARWFSHGFPDFLAGLDLATQNPAVAELCAIERALGDAFDAADQPALSRDSLAQIMDNTGARLTFHPSVALLRLATNSYDIFNALRADQTPPDVIRLQDETWVLIWRKDLTCRHMQLQPDEGAVFEMAMQGHGFEHLCEIAATIGPAERAAFRMAQHLTHWVDNGLITQIQS